MIETLAAVVAVLLAAALAGALAKRLGQPVAVGHMAAGIALGPSCLGAFAPEPFAALFPPLVRAELATLGGVGVLIYMFLVGLRFDAPSLRKHAKSAWAVSAAGLALPLALGAAAASYFFTTPGLFGEGVSRAGGTLFVGAAMSVTAFPVLARILDDLNLKQSTAGTLSLAAGCLDDLAAWALLAGLTTMGAAAMPLASPAAAFAVGVALSGTRLSVYAAHRIVGLAASVLLALYLAKSGLNTRLDLLAAGGYGAATLTLILAACVGKIGGCYAAARYTGETKKTALAVGALMNARGLMELIVLNVGLQLRIIEPALFSIMALMALVTTLMAAPLTRRALK